MDRRARLAGFEVKQSSGNVAAIEHPAWLTRRGRSTLFPAAVNCRTYTRDGPFVKNGHTNCGRPVEITR
jgi:hypothetical protein